VKQTYHYPDTPGIEGLRVDVETRGRLLTLRPRGRRAWRFAPYLAAYSAWLTAAGPIEDGGRSAPSLYSLYFPPIPGPAHARQIGCDLRTLVLERPAPLALTLGVTTGCQLSCAHCSALTAPDAGGEQNGRPGAPLTRDELLRVVVEALELGVDVVTFTGGEPLLRDDLEELVAAVPPALATTLVFTNGLLLDDDRARSLAAAGLYGLHLSLDSPDPGEHDRLRGREGCFEAVRRAARAARRADLKLGLSTYADRDAVRTGRLAGVAALAAAWDAHEVTVFDAIATGRLLRHPEVHLTAADHRTIVAEGKRLSRRYLNRPRVVTQSWTNERLSFGRLIGCLAATLQIHVTARGELQPCDFTPLTFGNVREAPLADLWRALVSHPEWSRRSLRCRMQDQAFRRSYIDPIPAGAPLPYAVADLPGRSQPRRPVA
jgi:MoaA/NifB/PqqE/SkfB family radical SAM enzyme